MRALFTALLTAGALSGQCTAYAQARNEPVRHRPEIAVAGGWLGGAALGEGDANLRTREGGDSRLFSTTSRFAAAPTIEVRAGVALTRRYAIEGRIGLSHPEMRTAVSADVEGAPDSTLAERVDQYVFEGAVVATLDGLRFWGLVPFASGGAGYLRQLHEGQTLVEEGIAYHAGGGVKRALFARREGWLKGVGFRGDVRVYVLVDGIDLDAGARPHASASGSIYVTF